MQRRRCRSTIRLSDLRTLSGAMDRPVVYISSQILLNDDAANRDLSGCKCSLRLPKGFMHPMPIFSRKLKSIQKF